MARAVLEGVAHHLTQRGLDRRQVFFDGADYEVYLALKSVKDGTILDFRITPG